MLERHCMSPAAAPCSGGGRMLRRRVLTRALRMGACVCVCVCACHSCRDQVRCPHLAPSERDDVCAWLATRYERDCVGGRCGPPSAGRRVVGRRPVVLEGELLDARTHELRLPGHAGCCCGEPCATGRLQACGALRAVQRADLGAVWGSLVPCVAHTPRARTDACGPMHPASANRACCCLWYDAISRVACVPAPCAQGADTLAAVSHLALW